MPYAAVNGLRLYYEEEGTGPPLVLLNAATLTIDGPGRGGWATLRPYLAERYRVVHVEQRGHGRTDNPGGGAAYTRATLAADVAALIEQPGAGAGPRGRVQRGRPRRPGAGVGARPGGAQRRRHRRLVHPRRQDRRDGCRRWPRSGSSGRSRRGPPTSPASTTRTRRRGTGATCWAGSPASLAEARTGRGPAAHRRAHAVDRRRGRPLVRARPAPGDEAAHPRRRAPDRQPRRTHVAEEPSAPRGPRHRGLPQPERGARASVTVRRAAPPSSGART